MRGQIVEYVHNCGLCQKNKMPRKAYGHIPAKEDHQHLPWEAVAVDTIGPYTIRTGKRIYKLACLTIIDMATRWIEIATLSDRTSEGVALTFDRMWLSRYPRPMNVIHDNGKEFVGEEFQELLASYGIGSKVTTVKNPQANGILERAHHVIVNSLRLMEIENMAVDEMNPFDGILANVAFALRATVHTTLNASPAQLIFGRDMIMHSEFVANWKNIQDRNRARILRDNKRENKNRIELEIEF